MAIGKVMAAAVVTSVANAALRRELRRMDLPGKQHAAIVVAVSFGGALVARLLVRGQ